MSAGGCSPGGEVDQSRECGAQAKNGWPCNCAARLRVVHGDKFTFRLINIAEGAVSRQVSFVGIITRMRICFIAKEFYG